MLDRKAWHTLPGESFSTSGDDNADTSTDAGTAGVVDLPSASALWMTFRLFAPWMEPV
jgi:hypothetical protein